MSDNIPDDFIPLESLLENPEKLNAQLRLDLLRMIDSLRLNLATGGSLGIQGQNQLVQAVKLVKSLTSEIDKNDTEAGSSIAKLFESLPFNDQPKNTVTNDLPFEDL